MSATDSIKSDLKSDARDVVIAQLRRELRDLAETQDQAAELRTRLDSLAHLHEMLSEEKRRSESESHERHQKLAKQVAGLRAEIDTLTLKNSELEYHSQNLQRQNDLFEEVRTQLLRV
jgi:two-component sensor histidine kinase